MPMHVWKRDVLTSLSRLGLSARLPVGAQIRVIDFALRSGHTPPPTDAMHRELSDVFGRWGGYDEARAGQLAAEHSATMYRAGLLWYLLRITPSDQIEGYLDRRVRVEGVERLERASAKGPVVLFSGHYGLPVTAVIAAARALHGRSTVNTFFAPPEENPSTAGFAEVFAAAPYGIQSIQVSPRAPIAALRALRAGQVLTMQPDVYDNRNGSAVVIPFLDGLTYAMTGTAYLALRASATLIPVFAVVDERGGVTVTFDDPLAFTRQGDNDVDGYRLTCAMYECIERKIRERPDQWVYWQVLAERMIPITALHKDRRTDPGAWQEAYENARQWASQAVPELRELPFVWQDRTTARESTSPTTDVTSTVGV